MTQLTEVTKQCSQCGIVKPFSEFGKQSRNKSGLRADCKECARRRWKQSVADPVTRLRYRNANRAWREANREKEVQRARSKSPEKREFYNRQRSPSRVKAKTHEAIRKALRRGEMTKPSTCSRCGERKRLHAHHDDYSKPLNVMWLCQHCHGLRHQELNDQKEIAA